MIDWNLLRIPLAVLLASLIVTGTVWSWAGAYNTVRQDEHSRLEREYDNAKRRYNEARRNRALYKEYLESFLGYKDQGVIGEEKRLRWIEELEVINQQLKLSSLRYEISPQSQAQLSGLKLPAGIKLNSSKMKLTAGTLHEGDVLVLLTSLKNNAEGRFAVRQCDLTSQFNQGDELRYRLNSSYVNMICELEWYTVEVSP